MADGSKAHELHTDRLLHDLQHREVQQQVWGHLASAVGSLSVAKPCRHVGQHGRGVSSLMISKDFESQNRGIIQTNQGVSTSKRTEEKVLKIYIVVILPRRLVWSNWFDSPVCQSMLLEV